MEAVLKKWQPSNGPGYIISRSQGKLEPTKWTQWSLSYATQWLAGWNKDKDASVCLTTTPNVNDEVVLDMTQLPLKDLPWYRW